MSFFNKYFSQDKKDDLDAGINKTKKSFLENISRAVAGKSKIDEEFLDELEQILITADVGLGTTIKIIENLEQYVAQNKYLNISELNDILKNIIITVLTDNNTPEWEDFAPPPQHWPYVILVVGVNGVGKTTTIGKLAHQYKKQGKSVLLGAADTFRAAAVDQLIIWAERVGCDCYSKGMNADPAAVAYESVQYGINHGHDVIIIDTAGRLHNKSYLMAELSKIKTSINKKLPGTPHDVLLILDATTGQNAIEQTKQFTAVTQVTQLALTKLDGSAKGGVALGISDQFKIPIKFIGVGEGMEHLQIFNKRAFVNSLFS